MNDFISSKDRLEAFSPSRKIPHMDICECCDERSNPISSLVLILIGVALGLILMTTLKACDCDAQPVAAKIASAA